MNQEQIKKVIAGEVRAELGRQGKNRAELADMADISRSAINRKLNAEVSFTTEEILRVAKALNVSPSNFLNVGSTSQAA